MPSRFPFPGLPAGWYVAALGRELSPGALLSRRYFGRELVLFRGESGLPQVADATCPHMGASLSEGFFREKNIVCHWHNWRFDAGTGACLKEGKEWASLPVYDVRVEGRDILLRPPRPEAPTEEEDEDWMSWEPPVIKKKSDS